MRPIKFNTMGKLTNYTIGELFIRYRQEKTGEVVIDSILELLKGDAGLWGIDIAEKLGLPRRDLSAALRVVMGIGLDELVNEWHKLSALELLETTDLDYDEIARRCGYRRQDYLAAVFEREYGMTLYSYRRGQKRGEHLRRHVIEQNKAMAAETYQRILGEEDTKTVDGTENRE